MQNFTFGRKGLNWFLFAFILFVGNLSIYGQNCPTLTATSDNFCYLSQVSELDAYANDGGDGIRWYRNATPQPSESPIPQNEILENGIYYAGNISGNCSTRPGFTVTVDDLGPPESTFGNFYEPCEYSSSDVTTVGELKALFNTTGSADNINVYDQSQEFGTVELLDGDALIEGRSYFVGQDDSTTSCEFSSRIAIKYDPILATAPAAESAQTFCESATIADLEAAGINRWYSTATSNPALAPSTPLVDGQTYYASRIVNRTNSSLPPCESQARTAVTVTLTEAPDAGIASPGIVCISDVEATFPSIDEVRKFYLDLLEDEVPTNGTFNPSITQVVNNYNADADGLGDFSTTYTIGEEGCQDSVELTISVVAQTEAEAGDYDPITGICIGDETIDLSAIINNDPNATPGGTFSGTGVTANQFDPSTGAGVYTIRYEVDETSATCTTGSDFTEFTITVSEANAGESASVTLNSNDESINLFDYLGGEPDTGGTWSPGNGTFNPATDTPGDFTYTINDPVCGEDSATVTVIINNCDTPPNAGNDQIATVCLADVPSTFPSNDEVRKFYLNLLDTGVSRTGTFSPTIATIVDIYQADEDGLGDFTVTYTIGTTDCQDSVNLTIRVVEEGPANAGSFDDITDVCSDDDMIDLNELINNDPDATIGGTFSGESISDNTFDPSIGAGTYTITYSVDESVPCTNGSDSTTFTITVEESPVSTAITRSLCVTEARELISNPVAGLAYLQSLIEEAGVDSFDSDNFNDEATAEAFRLANFIEEPTSDSETFNFTYTDPSETICDDGLITVAITITNLRDAEAGEIEDQTVCGTGEMIDLTDFFTAETVPGGVFSGIGVDGNMFDTSLQPTEEGYEITYSVDDSAECVTEGTSDSTTFTIFIDGSINAGTSNSGDVCRSEVDNLFPTNSAVRNYYLNLLDDGVATNGTFNPTIQQLIDMYAENEDQNEFTTTYTITNGTCSDSVELTINVYDSLPAVIGDITDPDPICRNADDVNLFSFLPEDANPNGTFDGYEDGIFSPSMEGAGTFDITYTLTDDSPCTEGEASATFTITVLEAAFAGMDMDLSVCMDEGTQDLFSFLSVEADTTGEFTYNGDVITDGMMNPADFEAGEYEVVYTVPAINDCGGDTATFTITVEEAPGAPTVDGNPFTFCATDAPTGADLSATGTNLTYYTDEDLTAMLAAEDALTTGTYYVTQRNDEGACESEAAEITVNINDADTPTISETNPTFCEFDDATLAALTDMINETGTITWYDSADGTNALNSGTSLQDGVTYYASIFNVETGCESSVRLAVNVTIDDDCPITIPEGFSPNGDGLNDRFEIRNIGDKYPNFTIEIRNRFGDVVYKGNANTPDWDGFSTEGSFGSNVLPVGAYFYYLDYNDGSTTPVRGTVYLSR